MSKPTRSAHDGGNVLSSPYDAEQPQAQLADMPPARAFILGHINIGTGSLALCV